MKAKLLVLVLLLLQATVALAQPADVHFVAGVEAFQQGSYLKASEELQQSLTDAPSLTAALYLGNAYLKLGRLSAAKEALRLALTLEPGTPKRDGILTLIRSIDAKSVGKLTITTTPPGATVYVDSQTPEGARGTTPLEVDLAPGRHQIIVELDNYETQSREQQIKKGTKAALDIPLRLKGCELSLTAEPEGTRAAVDGGEPTNAPSTVRVGLGAHKVKFEAADHESTELTVQCDGTQPIALAAKLKKQGDLIIPKAPGTVITVDGAVIDPKSIDPNGNLRLAVGRHEVILAMSGRPPWTTTIEIKADAPVVLTPPPVPPPPAAKKPPAQPSQQSGYQGLYLGVQGGGNIVLKDWDLGTRETVDATGAHRVFPKTSLMAGTRVGFQMFSRLAIEAELHWLALPNRLDTGHGLAYGLNLPLHILPGDWTPIVEAGGGVYHVVTGETGPDVDVAVRLGVGLRGMLNNWLSLRAEARNTLTDGFDAPGASNLEILGGAEFFLSRSTP